MRFGSPSGLHRCRAEGSSHPRAAGVPALALGLGLVAGVAAGCERAGEEPMGDGSTPSSLTLRAPGEFASMDDDDTRSVALFNELGKVLQHPRCVNCHPSGEVPLQGDDMRPHEPRVVRGASGMGQAGMLCHTCHADENVRVMADWSMPGHPRWHLAPASMDWAGRPLPYICEQIKDPARNGGLSLEELVDHLREDPLVGWAWQPGAGRERAPGDQERFGELARAWVDAGAGCPEAGAG